MEYTVEGVTDIAQLHLCYTIHMPMPTWLSSKILYQPVRNRYT